MSLNGQINKAKPRLKTVAPLTAYICWTYAIVNVLIGLCMMFLFNPTVQLAIASIFTYPVWGIIFLSLGLTSVGGLVLNEWNLIKQSQLFGLFVKAIWLIALIARCFTAPQTLLITLVWVLFAAIQAGVYIYFLPQGTVKDAK